ncbi:hypothetical protein BDV12DRAFT_180747 [Aspergillus spectabilis]
MSGLEIFGLAAGILQVAEIGTRLSISLCTCYSKARQADDRIQSLSSDVALTSNVLRQLGNNLQQDEQAQLYSTEALGTTREILQECKSVFEKITNAINGNESTEDETKSVFQRVANRFKFIVIEKDLEFLRCSLDRLKSTMLLLLNVIMYAGQVRGRAELSALEDQRNLIQKLVDKKEADEKKSKIVQNTLEDTKQLIPEDILSSSKGNTNELLAYCSLITEIISRVDACCVDLAQGQYTRVRNGIVRIHEEETLQLEMTHGPKVAQYVKDTFLKPEKIRPPRPPPLFLLPPRLSGCEVSPLLDSAAGILRASITRERLNLVEISMEDTIIESTNPAQPVTVPENIAHRGTSLPRLSQIIDSKATYECTHPGCTASPFPAQYLLTSHTNIHSENRPHFCPVKGCSRGVGGKGFKRKNEMIRHGLVHDYPGYICPFCPERKQRPGKYPRPDNLKRHVRVHHTDKNEDDPDLRRVLSQRPRGSGRGRRRSGSPVTSSEPKAEGPSQVKSLVLAWTVLKEDELVMHWL